jgi:hypothetical protein
MTDLDALEKLAEAATPGPWETEVADFDARSWAIFHRGGTFVAPDAGCEADAAYIAAMSPDVALALIARLRAAEQRAEKAEAALERNR